MPQLWHLAVNQISEALIHQSETQFYLHLDKRSKQKFTATVIIWRGRVAVQIYRVIIYKEMR